MERLDQVVIKVPPGLPSMWFWEAEFTATVYAMEGQVRNQQRCKTITTTTWSLTSHRTAPLAKIIK